MEQKCFYALYFFYKKCYIVDIKNCRWQQAWPQLKNLMKTFFKVLSLILFAQMFAGLALAVCDCSGTAIPIKPWPATCGPCIEEPACTWDGAKICPAEITSGGGTVELTNPLGDKDLTVPQLINRVINVALGIVGSLALIMFIYGGFVWMLAGGNEQAVTKGKNILMWAAIGLVVIFASYSLVSFVITSITAK
jgi:hypothetical protein